MIAALYELYVFKKKIIKKLTDTSQVPLAG